jgi:hypothetical protein
MISYLEFANYSQLEEFLAQKIDFDWLDFYLQKNKPFQKNKISGWQELQSLLNTENMLFESEFVGNQNFLVNIQDLIIDKYATAFLKDQDSKDLNLFLYSLEKEKLLAEEKKILKKDKIEYQKIGKSDSKLRLQIANNYHQKLDLNFSHDFLNQIVQITNSFQEIVDILDFLELSEIDEKTAKEYFKAPDLPIFMTSFATNNLERDTLKWYQKIESSDDIQLGLSLLMTKLNKQNNKTANKIKKLIINTDQKIKTAAKVDPMVWWKLLLWKTRKEV